MNKSADVSRADAPGRFSREAAAGYERQVIEGARVVLVGCGAVGQFLALGLALIGYPDAIFVDMDRFEESNQGRSPFYERGRNKARATATGARRLCTAPGQPVYRFWDSMIQWLGDAVFTAPRKVVVLAAVDSQVARQWLAWRCRATGVPLIEAGFRGHRWNLSVFLNEHEAEPCWACDREEVVGGRLFSCETYARTAAKAGLIPATAPGAMTLAAWQLDAATALLHGDSALAHCTLFGDLRTGRTQVMRRTTNPDCALDHRITSKAAVPLKCGPDAPVGELLDETARLADEPVIRLPASFIRVAPCVECRRPARIQLPEWAVADPPLCVRCDGPFETCDRLIPEQHGSLSSQTSGAILELSAGQLGLGPGLHLQVVGRDHELTVRLAGDAQGLLKDAAAIENDGWTR